MMTLDELKKSLPANLVSNATPALLDRINDGITDSHTMDIFKENLIDYIGVLQEGRFKGSSYIDAVRYVSFKLLGHTNEESYAKTFPDRYRDLLSRGHSSKDISAYVSAYNNGKLVTIILEQTLVPFWLVNQRARQEALNQQVYLMINAESEYVQTQAANSVLAHTEKPKEAGPLINFDMREESGMTELKDLLSTLAQKQVEAIQGGMTTKEIADQAIEVREDDD